jgi:hypothetical protein
MYFHDEDVLELDVPVDDVLLVKKADRPTHISNDLLRFGFRELFFLPPPLIQVSSDPHELQNKVEIILITE